MAISLRAVGDLASNTNTTVDVVMPASAQVGDVAVIGYINSDNPPVTITPPSGWSNQQVGAQDFIFEAAWKTVQAGDPGSSFTYTTAAAPTGHGARMVVFQGATVDDIAGNIQSGHTGITKTFTVTANYTATTDCWVVILVGNDPSTVNNYSNDEASMTEHFDDGNITAAQLSMALYSEAFASSGSGTRAFTSNDDQEHAWISFPLATASTFTLDQEGFRWRFDDGSESTATWVDAQDTSMTAPNQTPRRLRVLIDASDDPTGRTYELECKLQGDPASEWDSLQ